MKKERKTKIVCTIGPASESPRVLAALLRAGMDAARLNFSHGTWQEHARKLKTIRDESARLGKPVAVIQDLAGPKIRVGVIPPEGIELRPGEQIALCGGKQVRSRQVIPVTHPRLARDVKPGDLVLLADGAIELKVERIQGNLVYCRVLVGGMVVSGKGVNIPSEPLSLSALTAKDRKDLEFAARMDVDFVALSFVRSEQDIKRLKSLLKRKGREVPVIAKIEKPQALERIDRILEAADGIMVARGDLGVEIPLEQVPGVQRMLIRKANQAGKPVITATQMLRSMVDSPRPTRAEVSDVSNAIWEGTDAVMLSEETATGRYPVEAVKVMDRIARTAEHDLSAGPPEPIPPYPVQDPAPDAISYSVYVMSRELAPAAIVTPTRTGATARRVSRYRPAPVVLALTPSHETMRRLCITRGVRAMVVPEPEKPADITEHALAQAKRILKPTKGELLIITGGTSRSHPGATNTIRIEKI